MCNISLQFLSTIHSEKTHTHTLISLLLSYLFLFSHCPSANCVAYCNLDRCNGLNQLDTKMNCSFCFRPGTIVFLLLFSFVLQNNILLKCTLRLLERVSFHSQNIPTHIHTYIQHRTPDTGCAQQSEGNSSKEEIRRKAK